MHRFKETILQIAPLSEESQEALWAVAEMHELDKSHTLVQANTICHYFYFIEKGLTRTYYYKDGKDITDWLSVEGTFAVSLISFINRSPDRRIIETLELTTLYALSYKDVEALCKRFHDIEHLIRKLISIGCVQLQQKFDEQHFSSARERYQNLINNNPGLLLRVPLGYHCFFSGNYSRNTQ